MGTGANNLQGLKGVQPVFASVPSWRSGVIREREIQLHILAPVL